MSKELSLSVLFYLLSPPFSCRFFLLLFFFVFWFCPHISAALHPCRRRHCKCHVENEGGEGRGLLFGPGEASFCYFSADGNRMMAKTGSTHTQIFWSLKCQLWRAWQVLVFQSLTLGQAGGSFSALRQTTLIRPHPERAALNHSASKPRLYVGFLPQCATAIPGVVWLPFSTAPSGTQPNSFILPAGSAL